MAAQLSCSSSNTPSVALSSTQFRLEERVRNVSGADSSVQRWVDTRSRELIMPCTLLFFSQVGNNSESGPFVQPMCSLCGACECSRLPAATTGATLSRLRLLVGCETNNAYTIVQWRRLQGNRRDTICRLVLWSLSMASILIAVSSIELPGKYYMGRLCAR